MARGNAQRGLGHRQGHIKAAELHTNIKAAELHTNGECPAAHPLFCTRLRLGAGALALVYQGRRALAGQPTEFGMAVGPPGDGNRPVM